MDTFTFTIDESSRPLTIDPQTKEVGSQFDNGAQQLRFIRPDGRDSDNLILYFELGKETYREDLGTESHYTLTNAFTQKESLKLQVAFIRDGTETEHSSIVTLRFRPSLKGSAPVPEPLPDPLRGLSGGAEGQVLAKMSNANYDYGWQDGGGGGGVSKTYVDQRDAAVLEEANAISADPGNALEQRGDGKFVAAGSYTLPQATDTTLGGVKAKAKTDETAPVAIDPATGQLFSKVAAAGPAAWGSLTGDIGEQTDLAMLVNNSYQNRNWLLLGDSVTKNTEMWVDGFFSLVPAANVVNYAINGATFRDKADTVLDGNPSSSNASSNTLPNQVQKAINNALTIPTPDIVVLFAGINDLANDIPAETDVSQYYRDAGGAWVSLDSLDRTGLAASARWCVESLREQFPEVEVLMVVPYRVAGRVETRMNNLRDIILASAERLSCEAIDLMGKSGMYDRFEVNGSAGRFLSDGVHPNARGAKRIANRIHDTVRAMAWEKPEGITFTNLLPNSNFETADEWSGLYGMPIVAADNVLTLTFTGDPQTRYPTLRQNNVPYISGHVYYYRINARVSFGAESWSTSRAFAANGSTAFGPTTEKTAEFRTISAIMTAPEDAESTYTQFRLIQTLGSSYPTAEMAGHEMQFSEAMLVDVTAACGAGSEKSQSWLDENLPYTPDTVVA